MVRSIVPKSVLAWLLHYANSDPSWCRDYFYRLKAELLRKHGTFQGHDIQEIVKECYGDKRDHYGYWEGCGPSCRRCGGTGIFDVKWHRLQRWQFAKYTFYIPDGQCSVKPESIQIHGRIEHENYGRASREAELWLYLVTLQFRTFWHVLSTSSYARAGWWPMCNLQRLAMYLRMKLSWQRCWCGRWFPTWGTGLMMCKKCRQPRQIYDVKDPPF